LHELLLEGRRAPEIVIVLRCSEKSTEERCLDKDELKRKYDKIMEDREKAMLDARKKDYEEQLANMREEKKQDPETPPEELIPQE